MGVLVAWQVSSNNLVNVQISGESFGGYSLYPNGQMSFKNNSFPISVWKHKTVNYQICEPCEMWLQAVYK